MAISVGCWAGASAAEARTAPAAMSDRIKFGLT
jgi:hypothetical protein